MKRPWLSGFCNPAHDESSHARCDLYSTRQCACPCHEETPMIDAEILPAEALGFYGNIPEPEYHAHPASLSVSGAKVILKAPALFKWQREHAVYKKTFDFGSAAHALVLGAGLDDLYVAPFNDWRTKQAQVEQQIAREDGLIPILPKDWDVVVDMADALSAHRLAMRLLSEGRPEVSAFCPDEATGVLRRGRFDWLGRTILTDYKTSVSSDPDAFVRTAINFGYHMQAAWYTDLAADLGHPAEAFAFIVQEKEEPYLVTVIELPVELVDVGRARNRRALERFRDCTEADLWPGYIPDDTFATPSAPAWALREDSA